MWACAGEERQSPRQSASEHGLHEGRDATPQIHKRVERTHSQASIHGPLPALERLCAQVQGPVAILQGALGSRPLDLVCGSGTNLDYVYCYPSYL